MKRFLVAAFLILTLITAAYFLNQYWIHRYDALIAREAAIYRSREWAAATGMRELERQMTTNAKGFLREPENNIRIGCWYLEKIHEQFQDSPETEPRMIAAYNAGPSRAVEWNRTPENGKPVSGAEFITRIDIPSTRAYVSSIMERYRQIKASKGQVGSSGNP